MDLTRSSPTPAATELLLSTILPTASLVYITIEFSFCRKGLLWDHTSLPTLLELMKLTDTALRNFWSKEVYELAPIIGKVGYLDEVNKKTEYVDVIADAILRVATRSKNEELRRTVEEFEGCGGGIGKRTWRVLLDVLKTKKGCVGSRLKSLVETSERVSHNMVDGLEDSLLFDEAITELESGDEDEDIFLGELETEEGDELFAWSDGNAGDYDIFDWADENEYQGEDEVSLFEELEDPIMTISYHRGNKNILSLFEELEGLAKEMGDGKNELLFMEENELMLEDTALTCSEGEDMIWI